MLLLSIEALTRIRELEILLHSQIATTADLSLLRMSVSRPKESVIVYSQLPIPYLTPLAVELDNKFGEMEALSRLIRFSREAASELGEWAADHLWSIALADEEEAKKVEREIERSYLSGKEARPVEVLDKDLERIRKAKEIVRITKFPPLSFNDNILSSKVKYLHSYLNSIFERPTEARCIVFVKQRYTARLLGEIFKRIGSPYMKLGLLIGTNRGEAGDLKFSVRQQVLTLMKFRKGDINCLFATSIAEEGLDIPDCNTVVRFDLYSTLIQYIQSRGRARHKNSRYVHMTESGNHHHLQAVRDVHAGEAVLKRFCEALPADRLLQGNDCDLEDALAKERSHRTYTELETKAKLTYRSALDVLAHFVCSLPHDHETILQATYIMSMENKQYVCEVLLPEIAPVHSVMGRPSSRKAVAKCSAAFEACLRLRKGNYLDAHLLPIYHKQLPAMRNAHLALNMKQNNNYDMRVKPIVWEENWGSVPKVLYMTILDVTNIENIGRPTQPLALLTRFRFPDFPSFPLHLRPGTSSDVNCKPLARSFILKASTLTRLNSFTLRIYKDLFNKTYESDEANMSYWLAPLLNNFTSDLADEITKVDPGLLVDWSIVDAVYDRDEIPWTMETPLQDLTDKYLIDRWDGGRRFFSVGVDPKLRPNDPVPEGCAAHKYMENILEYTVSLFAKSRARMKDLWKMDQPVILAHRILHRRNWLDDWDETEKSSRTLAYLCPEPLRFSAVRSLSGTVGHFVLILIKLPTTVVAMAYVFPAIIFRLEAYLTVMEACSMIGLDIKPHLALEALTKDSNNTEEPRVEQVQFQRGMGKNYERLEFIGDCFLKMATSISLYAQNAIDDEFESHVKRMLMLCNKNLYGTAVKLKLYEYIRSQGFSRYTKY